MFLLTFKKKCALKISSSDFCLCVGRDFDLSNKFSKGILVFFFDEIFSFLSYPAPSPPSSSLWIVLLHEKAKHLTFPWPRDFSTPLLCSSCSPFWVARDIFNSSIFTAQLIPPRNVICCIFSLKWVKFPPLFKAQNHPRMWSCISIIFSLFHMPACLQNLLTMNACFQFKLKIAN